MIKLFPWLCASVYALSITPGAKADLWSEAQQAYDQRENNPDKIAEAKAKYLQLAQQSTGANRIKAVTQLGRLAVYDGEMLHAKTDSTERSRIFGECWCQNVSGGTCTTPGFVEYINPANVGENSAYYYFKGLCLGYWGEVQPLLTQIRWVGKVDEALTQGMERADARFEGSSLNRLAGAFYSNEKVRALGFYRPEYALERAIEATSQTDAYPGEDQVSGADFYENWRVQYLALKSLGRAQEAQQLAATKLAEMSEAEELGLLPPSRIPESKWVIRCLRNEVAGRNCHD